MSEKINQVSVFKDDVGEWWLEFYENKIRHQVTIEDVANGLASYVNMQVANAVVSTAPADAALECPDCGFEFNYPICGKCGAGRLQPNR